MRLRFWRSWYEALSELPSMLTFTKEAVDALNVKIVEWKRDLSGLSSELGTQKGELTLAYRELDLLRKALDNQALVTKISLDELLTRMEKIEDQLEHHEHETTT